MRRIGIKIGTELIVKEDGKLDTRLMSEIARECVELIEESCQILIVSSGAIKSVPTELDFTDNERAAIGQGNLIETYRECFELNGYGVAQFLPTYHDLKTKKSPVLAAIDGIMQKQGWPVKNIGDFYQRNIPIINYNDTVDDAETREMNEFADNDNLLRQICILLGLDLAIIAFAEDGLMNPMGEVKRTVDLEDRDLVYSYIKGGSKKGYGKHGMRTKVDACFTMAQHGIRVVLAPGRKKNFITNSILKENIGTVWLPKKD